MTGLLTSTASALTSDEVATSLKFSKQSSPLCDIITKRYTDAGSYQSDIPFFLLKDSGFVIITALKLIGPIGSPFDLYTEQKWQMEDNGFATFKLSTASGAKPSKYINFYFDLRDKYKTDVCIRSGEIK